MATFERRGKRWRVRVRQNGVNVSRSFDTKAEAKLWAAEVEVDASAGRVGKAPAHMSFGDLMERYADVVTVTKRGADKEYIRIERFLGRGKAKRDEVCDVPLHRFTKFDLMAWRDRRLNEVSSGSVARELNLLKAICSWATNELGYFSVSPGVGVANPKSPPPRNRRVSEDEVALLKQAARYVDGDLPKMMQQQTVHAFMLAIETAMRAGEILGLLWEDVDLDKRVVHLRMTKNGEPRDVPLSSRAVELIEQMRGLDDERVFTVSSGSLDGSFRKLKKRAGIEDLHFHDSRAEALTRLSKKVDVMRLARISGHKDVKLLFNTYYRETAEEIAQLLD